MQPFSVTVELYIDFRSPVRRVLEVRVIAAATAVMRDDQISKDRFAREAIERRRLELDS